MAKLARLILVVVLLLMAGPVLGWGREGHRIAGAITWHYLNDNAKKAVEELLGI